MEKQIHPLMLTKVKAARKLIGSSGERMIIPVSDDIDAAEGYTKEEVESRCKLASLYRLMDAYGWTENIWNHHTMRVPGEEDHFLMSSLGLLFHEITAGSLVKVDTKGNVICEGNTALGFNTAAFILHSPIYAARPDVNCIIHMHGPSVIAVSVMKEGLLPITQHAMMVGDVSYHEFLGAFVNDEEKKLIVKNLGPKNKVMFLRSHGIVVCGSSVEEAFDLIRYVNLACDAQVQLLSNGTVDNMVQPSEEAIRVTSANPEASVYDTSDMSWERGVLEFEAEMRALDYAGYRTGYPYRVSVWKTETKQSDKKEEEKGKGDGKKRSQAGSNGKVSKRAKRGTR